MSTAEAERFVDCENFVHWAGEFFSYVPGDIVSLPETIATAREKAGLLKILTSKEGQ